MPQKVSLNLYLLRAGIAPSDALESYDPVAAAEAVGQPVDPAEAWLRSWVAGANALFEEGVLPQTSEEPPTSLLVRSAPAAAAWQTSLAEIASGVQVPSANQNQGALLFQSVGGRVVVWSFGNAWPLLDPKGTVERFGLRAGLNALISTPAPTGPAVKKEVGVRGLTAAIRAAVVRKSTVQTARPSSPGAMERVDQSSDAASMAELTTHHDTFGRCHGGRSLRFEAVVASLADLEGYASEAIRLFELDSYKTDSDYNWIDYTVPVTDKGKLDSVLDEVWIQANATPPLQVDLLWADADPVSGVTPSYVCLPRERIESQQRPNLPWISARTHLNNKFPGEAGHAVLTKKLRFYHDDKSEALSYEVRSLLVAQVALDGETYFLSDGEVFRASNAHVANIENLLQPNVVVNPPYLPRYQDGEKEGDFNARAASAHHHFLLDKNLLNVPGQTKFEPCDLLSADGRLMHVKRKTRSSTMSHVMTQALVSTRMLRNDANARQQLDDLLVATTPAPPQIQDMRDHCASFGGSITGSVEIVIVGRWNGIPDVTQLPLLTKLALNSWVREMPCERRIVLVGT